MHTLLKCTGDVRKKILDLVFGGFPFLLCCSGAYGLASRCNFPFIAMDVFIDAHIVEVHWRCTRRILGLAFGGISVFIVLQWCTWIGIKVPFSGHSNRCVHRCTHC
jgi:hypothetical protein